MNYWCVLPPIDIFRIFPAVEAVPNLYQHQPLHDGCNQEKIGQGTDK
jgi:hypothetical protein